MKDKKIFIWVLIIAVAILVSAVIILSPVLAISGNKNYQQNTEISTEPLTTPEEVVAEFYTWYLAYIGDPAAGEMRNPLVDGAYRESGFLSDGFIQELDDLNLEGSPADPILMAQDIPQDFSVEPGTEAGTAIVHLQFGPDSIRHLKVSMVENGGGWMITGISLAE